MSCKYFTHGQLIVSGSDGFNSQWIVFFRTDARTWRATTCTLQKRKRGRLAAHCSLGHPHTPADPLETSSKAAGQLLTTSSVEHAGKCRKLAWGKGSSNPSTSGGVPSQSMLDANIFPGDVPLFLLFVNCIKLTPKQRNYIPYLISISQIKFKLEMNVFKFGYEAKSNFTTMCICISSCNYIFISVKVSMRSYPICTYLLFFIMT